MARKNSNFQELIGIQYLRGLAALLVVLAHVTGMAKFPKYFNFNILSGYFDLGTVGVELFFVISGFIISYVALQNGSLKPKTNAKDFFIRRFVRIIPFMWACIVGFALLRILGRGYFPWLSYVRAFVLYPLGEVEPRQIWTLRHEFLFYIVFSLCILRSKQQWWLMVLWFLSPVIWRALPIHSDNILVQLAGFIFSRHNILFSTGCVIGVLYKKNYFGYKINTTYGYMLSILSIVPLLWVLQYMSEVLRPSMLVQEFVIGIICSGIVVLVSTNELNLFSRIGKILGDASYSISHSRYSHRSSVRVVVKDSTFCKFGCRVDCGKVASCVAGIIVHLLIEKPLIKLIQDKMKGKQKVSIKINSKIS